MTPPEVAFFLFGCVAGACLVLALTGIAIWFIEWRQAWRGGDVLDGAELERAKRRGDL